MENASPAARAAAFLAAAAAVSLLPAPRASGQAPPESFAERANVTLVEVPVTVTARDGSPIRGLTAGDFELSDDGDAQRIEAMDVADLRASRDSGGEPWTIPAGGRRHVLFLFDLTESTAGSLARARDAAAGFARERMPREDLAAVACVSVERGLRLLVTFTSDRDQIARAIESIGYPASLSAPQDPLAFAFHPINEAAPAAADNAPVVSKVDSGNPTQPSYILHQKSSDDFAADQVRRQLASLGLLAGALDSVAGRKSVIFFSEGFDGRLLMGETDKDQGQSVADSDAMLKGELWNVNVDRRYGNSHLQDVFTQTMEVFRRSHCAIYPIDIGGLRVREKDGAGASRYRREALDAMAQATEGETIRAENDFAHALDRFGERETVTYVLFFRPTRIRGEGTFHRLKVRVRRDGARVAGRSGYYEKLGFSRLSPLARAFSAADVISQEKPESGFPVRVLALCLPSATRARVPVLAEIPGEKLLVDGDRRKLRLGLYLYAVSDAGVVRDYRSRAVTLDLERDAEHLRRGPLRYYAPLQLPPGRYRIRVLARDESNGRAGFQAVSLEVPEAGTADPLLSSPPLFVAPDGGVSLRDGGDPSRSQSEPLELAGDTFVPQADPDLTAGRPVKICLLLHSKPGETGDPGLEIRARLRGEGREDWSPARVNVLGRTSPDLTGLWKVLVDFAPEGLPAGRYVFEIHVREQRSSRSSVGQAGFRVSG